MQATIIAHAAGSSKVVRDKAFSSFGMEKTHQRRDKLDMAAQRITISMVKISLILKALTEGLMRAKIFEGC